MRARALAKSAAMNIEWEKGPQRRGDFACQERFGCETHVYGVYIGVIENVWAIVGGLDYVCVRVCILIK